MITRLGMWTATLLDDMLRSAFLITDAGERIDYISRQFINTPYKEASLIGGISIPEEFVIDLEGLDCMTFIEYVEAMRLSGSFEEFTENLKRVRYRKGVISYENRRHFFTDWTAYKPQMVRDMTNVIGGASTIITRKNLNVSTDGSHILHGISPTQRDIAYIPSNVVNKEIIEKLKTGDYVGMYSDQDGLDVTHTGIIIKGEGLTYLRHASSRSDSGKVLDEDLTGYLNSPSGIIILRPEKMLGVSE